MTRVPRISTGQQNPTRDPTPGHGPTPNPGRDRQGANPPLAYFLTFSCYGTHLHGHQAGSVDRDHNLPGTPYLDPNPVVEAVEASRMKQPPYKLNLERANVVLAAIKETCAYRRWNLLAAHVRSNHVHVVVQALEAAEKVMNDLKAYASRALTAAGFENAERKRWTRHGSTRYLWTVRDVEDVVHYVVYRQGEAMSVFERVAGEWELGGSAP